MGPRGCRRRLPYPIRDYYESDHESGPARGAAARPPGDSDWLSLTVIAAAAARRLGGRRPATGQGRRVILQVAVRLSAGVGHYEPEPNFLLAARVGTFE